MSKDSKPEKPFEIPTSAIKPPTGSTIQNSDWSIQKTTTKVNIPDVIKGIIKPK